MRTPSLKLAGTLAVLAAWMGGLGPAKVRGNEPPRAQKAAPPASPILELETDHSGSYGWGIAITITDVRAKPGEGIGKPDPGFPMGGTAAFTVVEIIDKDHVKVRPLPATSFSETPRSAMRAKGK